MCGRVRHAAREYPVGNRYQRAAEGDAKQVLEEVCVLVTESDHVSESGPLAMPRCVQGSQEGDNSSIPSGMGSTPSSLTQRASANTRFPPALSPIRMIRGRCAAGMALTGDCGMASFPLINGSTESRRSSSFWVSTCCRCPAPPEGETSDPGGIAPLLRRVSQSNVWPMLEVDVSRTGSCDVGGSWACT